MQAPKRLSTNAINAIYKQTYKVNIYIESIPDSIREFLVQYATSRFRTLSHILCTVLSLTASLMGPNVGTRLMVMNLVPCNVYMLNVGAKGGGKRPLFRKSFSMVFNLLEVMIPKCFWKIILPKVFR